MAMSLVTKDGILIGRCVGDDDQGWRFLPNTTSHKPSRKAWPTAVSVCDFETPFDAVKAGLHGRDSTFMCNCIGHEPAHVLLHADKRGPNFGLPTFEIRQAPLNGLQVLENQFICHIFAHGRTIAAARKPRKFNHPFRRAFSPKHPLAQPARRHRMPAGR